MDNLRFIGILAACFVAEFLQLLSSQSLPVQKHLERQSDWQQKVDHTITALLEPGSRRIIATEKVTYTNNSPTALSEIWFHVWPNAFKNNETGYGVEAKINGNAKYFNAQKTDRGWVEGLDFKINGIKQKWSYHPKYNDIVKLEVVNAIESGSSIEIEIPFTVKLPWLFSRMGVNENIFAVTQWYPKPAVYDVNGWNVFPYKDQGEYYSEFGDYKVSLTVPSDFVVGATGKLLDTAEWNWMATLIGEGKNERSKSDVKILEYSQKNIPDFAWFASPDFRVTMKDVSLPDGRIIKTLAFLKSKYESKKMQKTNGVEITDAIETALKYYSSRVGNYPYDYCSVVIGPLQGAGGMEYPMITICGDASEGTIIHEVGHNWFQCVLGSQERDHPWMDESINTFFHTQASTEKEKEFSPGDKVDANSALLQFRLTHDIGLFQTGNLVSGAYHPFNYGTIVYGANPRRFYYLQEYLGKKIFDSCMHLYFIRWQFKHPLPEDIQLVFELVSKRKLDWFFEGLISGSTPDYAIQKIKKAKDGYLVTVKNKGLYAVPVKLGSRRSTVKNEIWLNGNDTTVFVAGKPEQFSLNPSGYLLESNYSNNDASAKGILKTWDKIAIGFPNLYKRGTQRIWFIPNVFSSNAYDGFMPGLVLTNFNVPRRNWEFWAVPMYGVKSKQFTGMANVQRNIFHKKGPLSITEISMRFATFGFNPDNVNRLNSFYHYAPVVSFYLKRKKYWIQNIVEVEYDKNRITKSYWVAPGDIRNRYSPDLQNDLLRIAFTKNVYRKISPGKFILQLDMGRNYANKIGNDSAYQFAKATLIVDKFIPYKNKQKKTFGFYVKGFAETFIHQKNQGNTSGVYNPVVSGANGGNDYGYRQTMFKRSATFNNGSVWNNQLLPNGIGMRMVPNIMAKSWCAGVNAQTHLFPGIDLQVFGDAVVANTNAKASELFYTAGITYSQRIGNNVFYELSLPLVYSSNAQAGTSPKEFYKYMNFRISLNMYKPTQLIRNIYQ